MTNDQELQLHDHPPVPWCRPANVVELREAFARRDRGEVCGCGECPAGRPKLKAPRSDPPHFRICDEGIPREVVHFGDAWMSPSRPWRWADVLRLAGWTWDADGVDPCSRWFRLRRK